MPYEVFIGDHVKVQDRLNNAKCLGPFPKKTGLPVGAKTFKAFSGTCTFAGSAGDYLTLDAIAAALNAAFSKSAFAVLRNVPNAAPAGTVTQRDGGKSVDVQQQLVLQDDAGFTIDKTGTANTLLGLSTAANTVVPAKVDQTKIAGFTLGIYSGHFALIIAP